MSDRSDLRLSRRRLLLAVSTVGTIGALTGRGAAAYLTDREALADNRMTAGAVTLALDGEDTGRVSLGFSIDDYGFENRDEETICLGLGGESNPAWVWVRACPVAEIADELDARLVVDGETILTDSLGELLSELDDGVLLSELVGAGTAPIDPGDAEAVCLTLVIWAPETLASEPDTVRALKRASPFTVTIDAYAEQSRHVPTPRRPIEGLNPSFTFPACDPTGGDEGDEDDGDHGKAISNVSLCTSTPIDPSGVTWTVVDPDTGADATGTVAEPFAVRIESPEPIDYAVVKASLDFRRFDVGGETVVTVTSTGGTLLDVPKNAANCVCEDESLKIDWDRDAGAFGAPEAKTCGGNAVEEASTDERTGDDSLDDDPADDDSLDDSPPSGDPPDGDPSEGSPPGPTGGETNSTDDRRGDAPEPTGGGRPPNGDDK